MTKNYYLLSDIEKTIYVESDLNKNIHSLSVLQIKLLT